VATPKLGDPGVLIAEEYCAATRSNPLVCDIVTTLTKGTEFDLCTFPREYSCQIVALQRLDKLDHSTYMGAGCVGEFWTRMTYRHVSETFNSAP
jgi:farnesyl-diphosphate farnesyltransferase